MRNRNNILYATKLVIVQKQCSEFIEDSKTEASWKGR